MRREKFSHSLLSSGAGMMHELSRRLAMDRRKSDGLGRREYIEEYLVQRSERLSIRPRVALHLSMAGQKRFWVPHIRRSKLLLLRVPCHCVDYCPFLLDLQHPTAIVPQPPPPSLNPVGCTGSTLHWFFVLDDANTERGKRRMRIIEDVVIVHLRPSKDAKVEARSTHAETEGELG